MPLPIPQQVLAQPVTSYYKGKAVRQNLATAKKEEELLDLKIESAKNPLVDPKETRDQSKFVQESLANAGASAMLLARENPDLTDEEYTSAFNSTLTQALGEEGTAAVQSKWDRNGDGIIGADERKELESFTTAYTQGLGEESDQRTTLTSEEAMALPGMTQNRAENSVIQRDKSGQIYIDDAPTGLTEQDVDARVTGDPVMDREIVKSEVATRNLVGLVDRTIEQIDNISQAGMGLTGKVMRGIDEVSAEVQGIATALGGTEWVGDQEVPAGSLLDYRMYEWTGELANASAAIKSNIITLSYLKARSMEPAGRLAKDDVALARQSLGGDYASKGKVKAALNETVWQALNGMKNYYRATGNIGKFPTDLNDRMADLSAEIQKTEVANKAADLPVVKTDADFDNLKVGDKFVDENGKVYTKDKD